jgi:hypothetical protein
MAGNTTTQPLIELSELLDGVQKKYAEVQKELDKGMLKGFHELKGVYPQLELTSFNLDKIKELAKSNMNTYLFLKNNGVVTEFETLEIKTWEIRFILTAPVLGQNMEQYLSQWFDGDSYFLESVWENLWDYTTPEQELILEENGSEFVTMTDFVVTEV